MDDFDSFMKEMGIHASKNGKKGSRGTGGRKDKAGRAPQFGQRITSAKPRNENNGKSKEKSLGLEDLAYLEQLNEKNVEIAALKKELETLHNVHKQMEQRETLLKAEITKLAAERSDFVVEVEQLEEKRKQEQAKEQQRYTDLVIQQKNSLSMIEELRKQNEYLKQEVKESKVAPTKTATISVLSVFEQRGIIVVEEQLQLFQAMTKHPNFLGCLQHLSGDKKLLEEYILREVILAGEHIRKHSLIEGIVLIVEKERCELTGGSDLEFATREIITEMLLSGFRKAVFLDIPKPFVGLLRDLLTHESIQVQIAQDNQTIEGYDIIVSFGSQKPSISEGQHFFQYDCQQTYTIGEALLDFSKQIPIIE